MPESQAAPQVRVQFSREGEYTQASSDPDAVEASQNRGPYVDAFRAAFTASDGTVEGAIAWLEQNAQKPPASIGDRAAADWPKYAKFTRDWLQRILTQEAAYERRAAGEGLAATHGQRAASLKAAGDAAAKRAIEKGIDVQALRMKSQVAKLPALPAGKAGRYARAATTIGPQPKTSESLLKRWLEKQKPAESDTFGRALTDALKALRV
jgi:hypothetical protein